MADQTSKSRRWELGLRSHREELSSISKRTDNPEDRNHENKKEKRKWKMQKQRKREMKWKMQKQRKRERKMMEYQNKANYHSKDGDVAEEEEEEEEDGKQKDKMEKRKKQKQRKKRKMQKQRKRERERKMMEYQNNDNYNDVAEAEEEDDDHHSSTVVVVVDYDLLVSQILSRLPAKSLMRCKCVCKAWKSTIENDSHFINLHHTRSQAHPRFFIASFPPYRCRSGEGYDESSFFSADLHYNDGGIQASIDTVTRVPKSMHTDTAQRCLGPVRGLVCLIDPVFASQIRNVCTHQSTPWINSEAATVMYQKLTVWPRYQFGYDPNTGKHKVVYVWTGYKFKEDRFAEVLTVGDTRWRRVIDDVPQCEILGNRSAYVNGCVYWLTGSAVDKSQSLLAFDIGSEKFRMIPIPFFALWQRPCMEVIEMDGCITLILRVECLQSGISPELKLWKFRDDHDKEEWTEEEDIIIPSYIGKNIWKMFFHPIPGKDQMILEIEYGYGEFVVEIRRNRSRNAWDKRFYYSYDMRKKTFSKFETQGIPHVPFSCYTPCASYVESIFPVS